MRAFSLLALLSVLLFSLRALGADAPDRSTPRRTYETFTTSAHAGDFRRASTALDLRTIPGAEQAERGPELARELAVVLDRKLALDLDALPDDPRASSAAGVHRVKAGTIRLPNHEDIDVTLSLSRTSDGPAWLFSPDTVQHVSSLYEAYGPVWAERYVPRWLAPQVWKMALWQWLGLALAIPLGLAIGAGLGRGASALAKRLAQRTRARWDDALVSRARAPARLFLQASAIGLLIEPLGLGEEPQAIVGTMLKITLIIAAGWFAGRSMTVLTDSLEANAVESSPERFTQELNLRGIRTRVVVLRRIGGIIIAVVTASLVLLQFEAVRSVGVSILASAGLAGIVVGVAAQKTLATLLAGIQLSVTQPIKIGDSVVVESEFGTIEEINLTYVVVKTWDERRLIVPMTLFLEHPFQNWTKVSSPLTGSVMIRADFSVPMEQLRREFDAIVTSHPLWDGRAKAAQVTDASDRAIEIRFLVSAADAGKLFDLRCDVRERLVAWLRSTDRGRYLPQTRLADPRAPAVN